MSEGVQGIVLLFFEQSNSRKNRTIEKFESRKVETWNSFN